MNTSPSHNDILVFEYSSTLRGCISAEEVAAFLSRSWLFNRNQHITGRIRQSDGRIWQQLEGDPRVLTALVGRILVDPRHHSIDVRRLATSRFRVHAEWVAQGFEEFGVVGDGTSLPRTVVPFPVA